jgi:hypothetical protein
MVYMALSLLDRMCAKVWYKALELTLGVKTPHAVGARIDDLRFKDYASRGVTSAPTFVMKSFAPYADGKSAPSKPTIHMVDTLLGHLFPNVSDAFHVGPLVRRMVKQNNEEVWVTKTIPLWVALAGPEHALRTVLSGLHPEFETMVRYGSDPVDHASKVIGWLPLQEILQAYLWLDDDKLDSLHPVDLIYKQNKASFDLEQLTVMVLLWRYSMVTQKHFPFFNYLMSELYLTAVPDTLGDFGIASDFVYYCRLLANHYYLYLKKLEARELTEHDLPLAMF